MFFKGIRTRVTFLVLMILTVGMLLILYVAIMIAQKDMIKSEVDKNLLIMSVIENMLKIETKKISSEIMRPFINDVIEKTPIFYIHINIGNQDIIAAKTINQQIESEIDQHIKKARLSQKKIIDIEEANLWLLFNLNKNMIISFPVEIESEYTGFILLISSMDCIYGKIKKNTLILVTYVIANLLIFTLFAFYRISKIVIKPLNKLVTKAEEYKGDDEVIFLLEKQSNEFGKLSNSLNSMFRRISQDKVKLQQTVQSLEKANSDLKMVRKDIIRAEKLASIGRLASGIAHEIGNPIAIVLGYLELIKKHEFSPSEKEDFIQRSENEINRIKIIIGKLLNFARKSKDRKKNIFVHAIIEDIFETVKYQPLVSNLEIHLELNALSDKVFADSDQLRQVFMNLIINAADAVDSANKPIPGKLIISTSLQTIPIQPFYFDYPVIKIEFSDNGIGIPKDKLDYIYDPFFTTKDPGKGTGLGLAVCYMIIESIGGKIFAQSQENTGTNIAIYLPLKDCVI